MATKRQRSNQRGKNQKGEAVVGLLLLFAGLLLITIFIAKSGNQEVIGEIAKEVMTGGDTSSSDTNDSVNGSVAMAPLNDNPDNQDLSTGRLVCCVLPGISYPRTPALDRRVARRYLKVQQRLAAMNIKGVTFTWSFRTDCQQMNVKSNGNLKAKVGHSLHQAGFALDVNGLRYRSDAYQIIWAFDQEGFDHPYPTKDVPHIQIDPSKIGEPSKTELIKKAQENFYRAVNDPTDPLRTGGCLGPRCGE